MGNKIESPKIKHIILEISETTEISLNFLKSEFNNLFEMICGDLKTNKEIQNLFVEIILSLNEESILNFLQNLIDYLTITNNEDKCNIMVSFNLLKLILDGIIEKKIFFRDLISFSLEKAKLKNFNKISSNSNPELEKKNFNLLPFPFNLVNICIDFYNEIRIDSADKSHYEMLKTITYILSNFLNFNKNSSITNRTYVEFLDPYKFFVHFEDIITDQKISNFIEKLIFNFFKNFNIYFIENDQMLIENLDLILWFCLDFNKFFFMKKFEVGDFTQMKENLEFVKIENEEVNDLLEYKSPSESNKENKNDPSEFMLKERIENEYFFENDFNEKIFSFISDLFKGNSPNIENSNHFSPIEIIEQYNRHFSNSFNKVVLSNQKIFKDFVFDFFTNFEKLNSRFKLGGKIFLIYLFEMNLDICEMICLNRDYLKLILNKLYFNDFYDLSILNKLTLCKNFYICLRNNSKPQVTSSLKSDSEMKLLNLSEKCLESILINRKQILKLDSISYLLFLILYNISCFIFEINQSILLKFAEFITYFTDVELNSETFSDNLIIFNLFIEIILNLIYNVEFPGSSLIILMLLKFDEQLNSFYIKYENFYKSSLINDGWESYCFAYEKLKTILNKFKTKILEEAANIKFSQNNEVSIEKDKSQDETSLKENKIFHTESEKFVISSMYSNAEKSAIKIHNK